MSASPDPCGGRWVTSVPTATHPMATLCKTLPQNRVLPLPLPIRKESALKFHEELLLALDTLGKNPLRSALTILGIVIGIATVITVSSVINGLNENVLGGIRELGSDTI